MRLGVVVILSVAARGHKECEGCEGGKNLFCVHIDRFVWVVIPVNR